MSLDVVDAIISSDKKYVIDEPCDFVKLVYQASFGGGHLGLELMDVKSRLEAEFKDAKTKGFSNLFVDRTYDIIGNGMARMHIDNLCEDNLDLLARMFVYTSSKMMAGKNNGLEKFNLGIDALKSLAKCRRINLDYAKLTEYLNEYLVGDLRPVSHSKVHKASFDPHYRVVFENFARFFNVFKKIDEKMPLNKQIIISIDGGAASGKSTLATLIADFYNGNLIRMDDFFLEPKMRSKTRLGEVGGNVQHEKVVAVIGSIVAAEPFSYDVFDCQSLKYKTNLVLPKKLNVVEGVYCNHKSFNNPYDLKVFLKIGRELQMQRIIQRNGVEMAKMFSDVWIPFENRYFSEWNIENGCDEVVLID